MQTNESSNVGKEKERPNRKSCASATDDLLAAGTKIGDCDEIVSGICKHLPRQLLVARLVNKKWCKIASNILQERSNVWISLIKDANVPVRNGDINDELKAWFNMNPASRNHAKLDALDGLLKANPNFPCRNLFMSVGIQGSSGTPSTFIGKWIERIKSLHFDVKQVPYVLVYANLMPANGFVAIHNVENVQVEHGPFDWGLPQQGIRGNTPRLDRLKKLTLPGNLSCDRSSWSEVLREAVNLERIENCTMPFLPEIINQKKTGLVKSLYLYFHLKDNPALGLTLQENVNVFVQAVQNGLQLESILAFDIEVFISTRTIVKYETLPAKATLARWYQTVVQAFNDLLRNSADTLDSVQSISCLGYSPRGNSVRIEIPRLKKLREIDWLVLHDNPLMKMDRLFPLDGGDFLASQCLPNVQELMFDPSDGCWSDLAAKSRSDIGKLTEKLSMPSVSHLILFCSNFQSDDRNFINRRRNCELVQHFIQPMFPNVVQMDLFHIKMIQIPNILSKIFQYYSGTLQELNLGNRRNEAIPMLNYRENKGEMWSLDESITGLPQSVLRILKESAKKIHAKTVQLLQTGPSILSMKCLRQLTFVLHDPVQFHGDGKIPMITELSQLYAFDSLTKLKIVSIDSEKLISDLSPDEAYEYLTRPQADNAGRSYYQRYKYLQQQQSHDEQNSSMEPWMVGKELLILKHKIEQKIKILSYDSDIKELKGVSDDITCFLNDY